MTLYATHNVYLQPQRSDVAELNAVMSYWFKGDEMVSPPPAPPFRSLPAFPSRGIPPLSSLNPKKRPDKCSHYSSKQLLLTAIISLTINRWIDQNGA